MNKKVEIVQQWQYLGKVHPKLLEDEAFERCKQAGITSLQSYLYWAEIEKEPGKIDFSSYDVLVEKLKKHNLKWVPFLILGPEYATPQWFQESKESVFAKCLEHKEESKIQSIWNPDLPKYIDRFLRLVSEHYQDKSIFESILLGISGNWGEAIYPDKGGFHANFHTHLGWWCGDEYARSSFVNSIFNKYQSLAKINIAWDTNFQKIEEIKPPPLNNKTKGKLIYYLVNILSKFPPSFKKYLRIIRNGISALTEQTFFLTAEVGTQPAKINSKKEKQYWLDFVGWYIDSMTTFAEFWLKAARKYFPTTEIYLVTGGIGEPAAGADFSQQVKVAQKYNAGVRITNQSDDYSQSFILSRLVSSAARFYNSYFNTEEAGVNEPEAIIMRLFDAVVSGADGFYCKSIIGTGKDLCTKKNFELGKPTKGAANLSKNLHYLLRAERPIIKNAVFWPNTSIAFESAIITSIYNKAAQIRDILDFDLIDEKMILDGALENYKFFVVLAGEIPEGEVSNKVKNWERRGGKLIIFPPRKELEALSKKADNIDNEDDGVYATRFEDKIIYYNSNNKKIQKKVNFLNKTIEIEKNSIVSINL